MNQAASTVQRQIPTAPAAARDHAAFNTLAANCQERVFRLAFRITRNQADAEDAQQETLLKAHRNLPQFEGRARFTTWISRIAINESLMSLRKRRDAFHVPLDDAHQQSEERVANDSWHSTIEDPETAYARRELRDVLSSAIEGLAPRVRVVFVLRAVEELSTVETARILGISTSAVKTRLRRARYELQEGLRTALRARGREEGDEPGSILASNLKRVA
jgi:RNA polymerase sigma-70 factor, ECF subfamily